MKKIALSAVALLALGASGAGAKTLTYTFATASGTPYCDGVTITTTDKVTYTGTHTGSCEGAQPADGLAVTFKGSGAVLDIATMDSGFTTPEVFLISVKKLTWSLYLDTGSGFGFLNSGSLVAGAPPAQHGLKSSAFK